MSEQTTTKRAYRRISAEHLAYARKRFAEFASTSAVRAELKARGGDYPHSALHYWWVKANPPKSLGYTGDDADADHGPDEARPA